MFEMTLHPEALHAGVIAVAGRALLAVQLLMESTLVSGLLMGKPVLVRRPISSGLWHTAQRPESAR